MASVYYEFKMGKFTQKSCTVNLIFVRNTSLGCFQKILPREDLSVLKKNNTSAHEKHTLKLQVMDYASVIRFMFSTAVCVRIQDL